MTISAQLEQILRARCRQNLPNVTAQMVTDTRAACSRRTGALAESIQADDWAEQGDRYVTTISAGRGLDPDYARFQDEGTGVFSPTGMRIFPTNAKVLAFDWPAFGGRAFFRSVAGSPGTRFWSGDDGQAMSQRFDSALRNNF